MPENEFYIVPTASLNAMADAIRAKTGSQASIEYTQDGFADAINDISAGSGISAEDITFGTISGAITVSGSGTMRSYVFSDCQSITSVIANSITTIPERAFSNCQGITSASFTSCTNIGPYAFYKCNAMSTILLANANITVEDYAFYNCWALNGIDFSKVTTVGKSAFRDCWGKNCYFNPITVNDSGFRDIEYLGIEFWARLTTINGTYSFAGAYDSSNYCIVDSFVAPELTTIASTDALSYNNCLVAIDIGKLTTIQKQTFRNNPAFNKLILRKSSVTTLANIDAFTGTPFASNGSGGTLYVPQNLISNYQAASNWSAILSYSNNSIVAIEDTTYENYYADGTEISVS